MLKIRENNNAYYPMLLITIAILFKVYLDGQLTLIKAILAIVVLMGVTHILRIIDDIIIKDNKISARFNSWGAFRSSIDIDKIFKIERVQGHKVKSFNIKAILFRYYDENGKRRRKWIYNEGRYYDKDIKKLMLKLKEINPKIEFSSQYIDLMEGKYDKWFDLSLSESGALLRKIKKKEKKEIGDKEFKYVPPEITDFEYINKD